jgi:hypothetical protein
MPKSAYRHWLPLVAYMLIVALYFLARYQGYWAEADSSSFTRYIRDFVSQGRLIPRAEIYPNGYLDQALSTFIVTMAGLSVETLQQWIYPFLASITVPAAWIAYRAITGSSLGASVATALLLTQPEFLFVLLRSSHEKFTRLMILICLFLLATVISRARGASGNRWRVLAVLFWLASYTMVAANVLLATSFLVALAVAVAIGFGIARLRPHLAAAQQPIRRRVPVLLAGSAALLGLFIYVIYPPAQHNFGVFRLTLEQISVLFAGSESQPPNPLGAYAYINLSWIDLRIYFLLSVADWALLVISVAVWLWQGWRWIVRRARPSSSGAWLAWLLYLSFVLQGVASVVSDASGAFGGNLEVRLFPSFAMAAVAVVGVAASELSWIARPRVVLGLAGVTLCVTILSLLKVTNEPLFSNKWVFYRPGEIAAVEWVDAHLSGASVWTEFDERITAALNMLIPQLRNGYGSSVTTTTRDFVVSDITRSRAARVERPVPVPADAWQVYDNGLVQVYHRRPETPYQP